MKFCSAATHIWSKESDRRIHTHCEGTVDFLLSPNILPPSAISQLQEKTKNDTLHVFLCHPHGFDPSSSFLIACFASVFCQCSAKMFCSKEIQDVGMDCCFSHNRINHRSSTQKQDSINEFRNQLASEWRDCVL
jgi:hypothetical protein